MHDLTGLSKSTIQKGMKEIKSRNKLPSKRTRRHGGGRVSIEENDPIKIQFFSS